MRLLEATVARAVGIQGLLNCGISKFPALMKGWNSLPSLEDVAYAPTELFTEHALNTEWSI